MVSNVSFLQDIDQHCCRPGGACNVMVIIIGNGYEKQSSISEQGCLHFLLCWERFESKYSASSYG